MAGMNCVYCSYTVIQHMLSFVISGFLYTYRNISLLLQRVFE